MPTRYQASGRSYAAYTLEEFEAGWEGIIGPQGGEWVFILEGGDPMAMVMDEKGPNSYTELVAQAGQSRAPALNSLFRSVTQVATKAQGHRDLSGIIRVVRKMGGHVQFQDVGVQLVSYTLANALYRQATGCDI